MGFESPKFNEVPQETSEARREREAAEIYVDLNYSLRKFKENLDILSTDQKADLKRQMEYIIGQMD